MIKIVWSTKLKYLSSGPLQKKFATPGLMTAIDSTEGRKIISLFILALFKLYDGLY